MSELIQIEKDKTLTFEDICPVWASEGKVEHMDKYLTMDIGIPDKCIVGEAHKWSGRYYNEDSPEYCSDCKDLSQLFPLSIDHPERMERLVGVFVKHWNNVHTLK